MKYTQIHAEKQTDICKHLKRLYAMVVYLNAQRVVELGTRTGESTVALLEGVRETGGHLWSIDLDVCRTAKEMIRSYGYSDSWTFLRGDSADPNVARFTALLDLVFVDTSHTYEQTMKEINLWFPQVNPRAGAMLFHDVESRPEVRKAIKDSSLPNTSYQEFPGNNGLGAVLTGTLR